MTNYNKYDHCNRSSSVPGCWASIFVTALALAVSSEPASAFGIVPERQYTAFGGSLSRRAASTRLHMGILSNLVDMLKGDPQVYDPPCVMGDEAIMSPKAHGTSDTPVQSDLRWGCDVETADNICNFNRHYAEFRGYWLQKTPNFVAEAREEYAKEGKVTFYDSNTGKPLFVAPGPGRDLDDFFRESRSHGWPSFRDDEVVWDNVRCLNNGETVSVDGTHLGHNLPDFSGSRYCINLVCVAGKPVPAQADGTTTTVE